MLLILFQLFMTGGACNSCSVSQSMQKSFSGTLHRLSLHYRILHYFTFYLS